MIGKIRKFPCMLPAILLDKKMATNVVSFWIKSLDILQ